MATKAITTKLTFAYTRIACSQLLNLGGEGGGGGEDKLQLAKKNTWEVREGKKFINANLNGQ